MSERIDGLKRIEDKQNKRKRYFSNQPGRNVFNKGVTNNKTKTNTNKKITKTKRTTTKVFIHFFEKCVFRILTNKRHKKHAWPLNSKQKSKNKKKKKISKP